MTSNWRYKPVRPWPSRLRLQQERTLPVPPGQPVQVQAPVPRALQPRPEPVLLAALRLPAVFFGRSQL